MTSQRPDEEHIFHVAREIQNPSARSEYLGQICAGDQALRERVEALLKAHEEEQSFLESADQEIPATVDIGSRIEKPGATIGRYKLMEQIGEGGMGTVFVAKQERPIRRKVALKLIKPGMDTKAVVARFEAERQALAMMDHPSIAKVLDAGTTESGRPYFAMELVKGVPITQYCDRNRLTIRERLELFIEVCQAIQHAHQKGIIHRDIKPSNVLVTLHDGNPVPKVIDFGVAKALNARLTDSTIYTEHMQLVGTLLYMSPEQAELSGLDIDTRSDIYSLGVLLYELLTGTTPFRKEELDKAGFDEQRRVIRDEEPPRASVRITSLGATATAVASCRGTDPTKLRDIVCKDLDWVVVRCLEKDRTRRYETAVAIAREVTRYLKNKPVEAHPPSWVYQSSKFLRRNRLSIAVASLLLFTLSLGMVGTIWQSVIAHQALDDADIARQSAEQERDQNRLLSDSLLASNSRLQEKNYIQGMSLAYDALNSGNRRRVEELYAELCGAQYEQYRSVEFDYLRAKVAEWSDTPTFEVTSPIISISFCPTDSVVVVGQINGTPIIYDFVQRKSRSLPAHCRGAYVSFSSKGTYLAIAGPTLHLFDYKSRQEISLSEMRSLRIRGIAIAEDEGSIAIAYNDGIVELRDLPTGSLQATLNEEPRNDIYSMNLQFSRGSEFIAVTRNSETLIWDLSDPLGTHQSVPGQVLVAEKDWVITQSSFSTHRWLRQDGVWKKDMVFASSAGATTGDSADKVVAFGGTDFQVSIKSIDDWETIGTLLHTGFVNCVAISADGRYVAAGGRNGNLSVWHADNWEQKSTWPIAHDNEPPLAVTKNGHVASAIATSENSCKIVVRDPISGEVVVEAEVPDPRVGSLAFSNDTKMLAVGTDAGNIYVFDAEDGSLRASWPAHTGKNRREFTISTHLIGGLAFSPDDRLLISAGDAPDLAVWDLVGHVSGNSPNDSVAWDDQGFLSSLVMASNGLVIASGGGEDRSGITTVWQLEDDALKSVHRIRHSEWVRQIALSPDETQFAVQENFSSGIVAVYSTDTIEKLATLVGYESKTIALAYTLDGKRLVTAGGQGIIRFWDTDGLSNFGQGETVAAITAPEREYIRRILFLPDGSGMLSASWQKRLRFWRIPKSSDTLAE